MGFSGSATSVWKNAVQSEELSPCTSGRRLSSDSSRWARSISRPWSAAADRGPAREAFEELAERAAACGGGCAIAPGEAGGAEVRARLPWPGPGAQRGGEQAVD